jgi:hypothetical protein
LLSILWAKPVVFGDAPSLEGIRLDGFEPLPLLLLADMEKELQDHGSVVCPQPRTLLRVGTGCGDGIELKAARIETLRQRRDG